jgi:hypothetical protein
VLEAFKVARLPGLAGVFEDHLQALREFRSELQHRPVQELWKEIKDSYFLLLGKFPLPYARELKEKAKALGLTVELLSIPDGEQP